MPDDTPEPVEPVSQAPAPADSDAANAEASASDAAAMALRRATRASANTRKRAAPRRRPPVADGRDPQPLSAALDRLIEEQGWQQESAVAVLMADWVQIVGRELADHVQPVGFEAGVLTLRAESTTWATQVRLLLPRLHKAVDERVGVGVVTSIRIRGPQAPSWGAGPRRVPGRGPRDTYG